MVETVTDGACLLKTHHADESHLIWRTASVGKGNLKTVDSVREKTSEQIVDWTFFGEQARQYLAAGAWQSAHDLLWPHLTSYLEAGEFPRESIECLCLALGACSRLSHRDHLAKAVVWLKQNETFIDQLLPEERVLATLAIAHHEIRSGQYHPARYRLQKISDLVGASNCSMARMALLRGRLETVTGDDEEAERQGLLAAALASAASNDLLRGDAFSLLAILARKRGSLNEANSLYGKAANFYWRTGNLHGQATVQLNRAWALGLIGLVVDSYNLFDETIGFAHSLNRKETTLRAKLGMGWILSRGGNPAKAREILLGVWRSARRCGLHLEEAMALEYLTGAYTLLGETAKAARSLQMGKQIAARVAPDGDLALEFKIREAMLLLATGDLQRAGDVARIAIKSAMEKGLRWEEAQARHMLAMVYLQKKLVNKARVQFRKAKDQLAAIGEQLERQVISTWLKVLANETSTVLNGKSKLSGSMTGGNGISEAVRFWLQHPLLGPADYLANKNISSDKTRPKAGYETRSDQESGNLTAGNQLWTDIGFITKSPAVLSALHQVETYAPGRIPVLILGETGTGKDLIARGVHSLSRSTGELVPVNCAAASKDLFVAELFGACKGAYTGADDHRRGLIEEAENGTLFFDEIADLELDAQGYLLRFLDSGEVRPVGSTRSTHIKTRIVAATCRDLSQYVQQGRFREDLYARLAGLVVRISPLRERPQDLIHIAEQLWVRDGGDRYVWRQVFNHRVSNALKRWYWPGNVRELGHLVSRTLLLHHQHDVAVAQEKLLSWLADELAASAVDTSADTETAVVEPEKLYQRGGGGQWDSQTLQEALEAANGRVSVAARKLGISRSHAYRLYKQNPGDKGE